jgi:hypothetical protein
MMNPALAPSISPEGGGNGEDLSGDYVFNFFEPSILFSIKLHWRRTLVQW